MNLRAFIPFVNRPDLLQRVINQMPELWGDLTIIDNSQDGIFNYGQIDVFRPYVPLTFTETMNLEFEFARKREDDFFIHAHSDADLSPESVERLIEAAEKAIQSGKKWSVIFTYHDVLCAYNTKLDIRYDTNIRAYHSDQDFFRRCKLAGWEAIQLENHGVRHGINDTGSQTINSDPKLKFLNGYIQQVDSMYYNAKWGGPSGSEMYSVPFNRPDLFDV